MIHSIQKWPPDFTSVFSHHISADTVYKDINIVHTPPYGSLNGQQVFLYVSPQKGQHVVSIKVWLYQTLDGLKTNVCTIEYYTVSHLDGLKQSKQNKIIHVEFILFYAKIVLKEAL